MSCCDILVREDCDVGRSFKETESWRMAIGGHLLTVYESTLMYIEAEAKMDSFQAQDGSQRTALNLLQREFLPYQI